MRRFVLPILLAATLPAADSRIIPAMNAFRDLWTVPIESDGAGLV
jgi:hypothetical protein